MDYSLLHKYLPEGSFDYVVKLLEPHELSIKITRSARSRYGSFYHSRHSGRQHISISGVLNPYAFLITLIHEIAHMKAFSLHGRKIKPHGYEWKNIFSNSLTPLLPEKIFPDDLINELQRHLKNPSASVTEDISLFKCLRKYNKEEKTTVSVEEIPLGALFSWNGKGVFLKGEKMRKRYRCIEQKSKRIYLFSPVAEVNLIGKT